MMAQATGSADESANENAKPFCLNQLRELNYDRYLACLYLPENIRGLAIALNAFDAEIQKISNAISEPMTGEIRIQWWRDTLAAGISGTPTHNPLADYLLWEMDAHKLPLLPLDAYLQARIFDLYHDPMPDLGTLEGYCGETASVVFQLLTMAASLEQNTQMADICGHAGMVAGLTVILNSLPRHTAQNRLYLPKELLEAKGLDLKQWFSGNNESTHLDVVKHTLDLAENHLGKLRSLVSEYSDEKAELSLILLPIALYSSYLKNLRKLDIKIFDPVAPMSPLKKHWIYWRSARSRTF
ncbi:MAG: squalene/phytoene synthase family protein [Rhizobiaceae bacterium]|nr:squalene/phytoene synthase family protein [Rhizobiaceae bacterium]